MAAPREGIGRICSRAQTTAVVATSRAITSLRRGTSIAIRNGFGMALALILAWSCRAAPKKPPPAAGEGRTTGRPSGSSKMTSKSSSSSSPEASPESLSSVPSACKFRHAYDREEEYRLAQRAAVEAVTIGRETLATAVHQGEQLQHAESIADDTEYTLDKAHRLLRGMTWSGWLANKFSKEVDSPEYNNNNGNNVNDTTAPSRNRSILGPPRTYERIPEPCRSAVQAVQNYHLNLQVLEQCENDEQTGTCRVICDDMHRQARIRITEVLAASNNNNNNNNNNNDNDNDNQRSEVEYFAITLLEEAQKLRQRQLILQQRHKTKPPGDVGSQLLFDTSNPKYARTIYPLSTTDKVVVQQEEHLSSMAKHLQELGSLAGNLNTALEQQSEVLDSLDAKSDTLHFKTNAMNRRTDRFQRDKTWGKQPRAEFLHYAFIQHTASGRYLSIDPQSASTLVLSGVLNERGIFGIFRKKRVLGLQNKFSRKWVGQNVLGQLACSANTFERREEWEADGSSDERNEWSDTTLLLVSAGWGAGGYLLLDDANKNQLPALGGGDMFTKKQAPKWCIRHFERDQNHGP
eukprot:jgi/Psemu1/296693/fgenesh1_pm.184_\